MEQKIIEILKDNFKGQDIDKARKELCFLFGVRRSDEPKCPKCNNEELTCFGSWETGDEYRCDDEKCKHTFDWEHYA